MAYFHAKTPRKSALQDWRIGCTVRIGFVEGLIVLGEIDRKLFGSHNDAYLLAKESELYTFEPHSGLQKLAYYDIDRICKMVAKTSAQRNAA